MKRTLITLFFILSQLLMLAQSLEQIRTDFHKITSKYELEKIINLNLKNESISTAYIGSAEAMFAEYLFLPTSKYATFKKGIAKIEQSIHTQKECENVYLRLLIQLNTPSFLGYNQNIESDLLFFKNNIQNSKLSNYWKKVFITNILKTEHDAVKKAKLDQLILHE